MLRRAKGPCQNNLAKTEGADARRQQGTRWENTSAFDRRGTPLAAMQQRPNRTSYSDTGVRPENLCTGMVTGVGQVSNRFRRTEHTVMDT
jgi:hypothetical protein